MLADLLHRPLAAAVRTLDPSAEVEPAVPSARPEHGDYQWNGAFRLARTLRRAPRDLAAAVVDALRADAHPLIAHAEVAGGGFVNLHLRDERLALALRTLVRSPTLGVRQEGHGRLAIIDFSSPNVAKRMHVGHMRSTHIGWALVNAYRAAGWAVVGDNHIGDWGTQFGKLMVAWRGWLDRAAYEDDPIGELERLYVLFGERAPGDPSLEDAARAETAKLQRGDPENTTLWTQFLRVSLAEFEAVYERLGVRFDEMLGESAYAPLTEEVVGSLIESGLAEPSEGAIIVRFDKAGDVAPGVVPEKRFEGDLTIIRKRDGAANYTTTDLACLQYRIARWRPERIVYVTDLRQQLHFRQFFAIARRRGPTPELVHAWFGMLVLPEGAMSTRKGNVIRLVDLLDEGVRRARALVDEKSPHLADAERAAIAEAVGVGAIRWADLAQHPQTNITFAWERMLAMDGNTAPYLMYSHARAASLLAKAAAEPAPGDLLPSEAHAARYPDPSRLGRGTWSPEERQLAVELLRWPDAVLAAVEHHDPHLLTERLPSIAEAFNRFYHACPVVAGGEARAARLALVDAARRVMRAGGELVGLRMVERM